MKKMKRKIALLLTAVVLFGMNLVARAAEQQIEGEEIGAKMYRFLATEDNQHVAVRGKTTTILAVSDRIYDRERYEYINDENHVYTMQANNFILTGNTSPDTKLIWREYHDGFFESFRLQVGADEMAEELTISCNIGFWGYYLKDRENGEIFRVIGDDRGEIRSLKLKVKNETDNFGFDRSITAVKENINPGEETAIKMNYEMVYNEDGYELYNDKEHSWNLGIIDCTVSGNTCSKTRIEDRKDYANTRYLVVDTEEKSEELTVEMTCGRWSYYVKDKETNEIIYIYGGISEPEILTMNIKIGGSQDNASSESNVISASPTENNDYQQPAIEIKTNEVISANGEKQVSTIEGIYQVTNVPGIAILTPKEQVESAAGIENAGGNVNIRFYICNSPNTDEKKALEQAVAQNGKKFHTAIQMDMYAINKEGKIDKINRVSSKIRIVIGLPGQCRNNKSVYMMGILGENGELCLLEDLDNDPTTITIETERLGMMALME